MDIELKSIDSSDYLFDPTDDDSLEELRNYHEDFSKDIIGVDILCLLRYIILMYDLNTELRKAYPDYTTRKMKAALMAGFQIKRNGKFSIDVEDVLIGKNLYVNNMIVRYTMMFNNPDYMTLTAFTEMLARETSVSLSKEYNAATIANIQKLNKEIKILISSIFGGDPYPDLRKALYMTLEKEKLRLRPEDIADDIMDGKLSFTVDPYHIKEKEDEEDE